jgi:hypothetical protein
MSHKDTINLQDGAGASLVANQEVNDHVGVAGKFIVICRDSEGRILWEDGFPNLVVTTGKNDLLNKYFLGSAYTAAFFVGLKGAGTIAAGDTMASHAGWTEIIAYTNASRPAFSPASSTAGSSTNSASAAVFNINAGSVVAGCLITTSSVQSPGTAGTLFSAADFASGGRTLQSGDTLTVTYTISC